ncbi:carbohydrate kinase family protein [bacterium]|nr:carbohydrate kinase family protein [bacterium]
MPKEKRIDVVVAGHICFDVIPVFPQGLGTDLGHILVPGKLINVRNAATSTGGPVSNTGLALQRLGQKVAMMGKVGDDFFGRAVLDRLKMYGAEKGMSVVPGEATSYTIVIAPPGIDRVFLHNPGTNNTFGPEDVNLDIVREARLFHLGYPPLMKRIYENDGRELVEIFRRAKEAGATTSLDMSLPDPSSPSGKVNWDAVLKGVLPHVDIFLPSAEETMFMLNKEKFFAKKRRAGWRDVLEFFDFSDLSELAEQLLSYGAKVVGLKSGYLGFYVRTADAETLSHVGWAKPSDLDNWSGRELFEPSFHVEHVASATGSGDSAIAGFLAAYLNEESIESSIEYACAVGAQNVQVLDAVSGIRSWEETTRQLQSTRPKISLSFEVKGWWFDDTGQVWHGPTDKAPKAS